MLHLFWDLQCWDDPKSDWRVTQCCSGSLSCAWGWCTKTWPFLSIASNWWAVLVQRGSIHVHPNDLNYCWLACISWNRKSCQIFFNNLSNLLIPKHCTFFEILALKGSVLASKRRLFASKKRLFASKTDASGHFLSLRLFSPQTFVWSVLGGIIIQSILSQPFSDLQSCDGQESVQWIRNATMVFNPKTFSFMHQCYQCFCTDWYDYVYCAGLSGKTLNESVVGI